MANMFPIRRKMREKKHDIINGLYAPLSLFINVCIYNMMIFLIAKVDVFNTINGYASK